MIKTDEEIYKEFGEKIKNLRKQKGLTQTELAKKMGTTQSTIYKYEKGLRTIPLNVIEKFANVFETSVDLLLNTKENKNNDQGDIDTGNKIKGLREANNLTRIEMSKELDIDVSSLANFETGVSKVPIDILIKFATYFNVSIDDLVGIHNENESNDFKGAIFSKNPHFAEQYKKWKNELGTINFTNEELDEIINFAKYLVSKRTQ